MCKLYRFGLLFGLLYGCSMFDDKSNNTLFVQTNSNAEFASGTYKSDDESYLKIIFESGGLVLEQAENAYASECDLVNSLKFNQIAPHIYMWSKDSCQMTITTLTKSDKIVLVINKLERCFDQYDIDQPFSCFGRPMMEQQGVYIVGKMYKLDTNLNQQL